MSTRPHPTIWISSPICKTIQKFAGVPVHIARGRLFFGDCLFCKIIWGIAYSFAKLFSDDSLFCKAVFGLLLFYRVIFRLPLFAKMCLFPAGSSGRFIETKAVLGYGIFCSPHSRPVSGSPLTVTVHRAPFVCFPHQRPPALCPARMSPPQCSPRPRTRKSPPPAAAPVRAAA